MKFRKHGHSNVLNLIDIRSTIFSRQGSYTAKTDVLLSLHQEILELMRVCYILLTYILCNEDFNKCPSQTFEGWLLTRGAFDGGRVFDNAIYWVGSYSRGFYSRRRLIEAVYGSTICHL